MADQSIGRFVWYELLTPDPKAAIAFYTDVVGWKTQPFGDAYTMWVGSAGPLGGVMVIDGDAKKMNAPPHWIGNVQVENADATVAAARKLGARIYVEPRDIPTIGRYAVLADPQGATISVIAPLQSMKIHDDTKNGEFCWNELITTDYEAAFGFYSELFGWKRISEFDMGPMGKYLIYGVEGKELGGMFTKPKDAPMPPTFLHYIQVDDLDAALARVKAKDGKLLRGPMEVPGGARIVQLLDPQGAAFALHEAPKTRA